MADRDPDPEVPESVHTLASIETDATGRCRYVCACGAKGRFVGSIGTFVSADTWARDAHRWHASLASDSTRPVEWGST
jgi:hypothetical protein